MSSTSSTNVFRDLLWMAKEGKNEVKSVSTTTSSFSNFAKGLFNQFHKTLTAFTAERLSHAASIEDNKANRNRFQEGVQRVENSNLYDSSDSSDAPYGYFRGRPIIGECTKINGGIFVGALPHESIVVDEKYGFLSKIYATLLAKCSQVNRNSSTYEYELFSKAVSLSRETLRFSEEGIAQIQEKYSIQADEKVTLDLYIKKNVGVSRHQVLLAAYLLEKLRSENFIKGVPSIESAISNETPQERLLFTSRDGDVFRFDPTKGLGKTAIH